MATEWLICGPADNSAEISLLLGASNVLTISAATLRAGEQNWTSGAPYGEGIAIKVGQGYEDGETILVDILDGNSDGRIAELRLFKSEEGDSFVSAGTLRIVGHGAWAVACEGP